MTTGVFHWIASFSATARIIASGPLPAENVLTMVTGLVGKAPLPAAKAGLDKAGVSNATASSVAAMP